MRPGPPRGDTAALEVVVTPEMTTAVGDGAAAQAVYSTVALVAHVEQVCRRVLDPHLEPGEIGLGTRIEVVHRAPVPVGATVRLVATVASVGTNSLVCEVLVRLGSAIVARGTFEHAVVPVSSVIEQVASQRSVSSAG